MTTTEIHPNQTPIGGFGLSVNGSDQNGAKLVFGKRPLSFNQATAARATTTGAISRRGPLRLCGQYLRPPRRLGVAAPSQEGETANHQTAPAAPDEKARAEAQAARVRLTPLEDRLERLLATIPVELQREGLSLTTLQTSLRGRWRGNAHPGEIGRALRRLGFERRRNWRGVNGFRAVWRKSA